MKKKIILLITAISMIVIIGLMMCIKASNATQQIEPIDTTVEDAAGRFEAPETQEPETEVLTTEETTVDIPETIAEITVVVPETTQPETQTPANAPPQTQGEWTYAPIPSSAKTYEAYYLITDRTSKQWLLLNEVLIHGEDGMIRNNEGYIAAALGSYFGPIGSRWIFLLDNGKQIKIIKADQKQDQHTYNYNCIQGYAALDIIEFIVNDKIMPRWANGYIYGGNFNNCPEYQGKVIAWKKIS